MLIFWVSLEKSLKGLSFPSKAVDLKPEIFKVHPKGPRTPRMGLQGPNTIMLMLFGPQSPSIWVLYTPIIPLYYNPQISLYILL